MRRNRDDEFETYVRRRRGAMLRSATALTGGDGHMAEDLVQVALVRLYVRWSQARRGNVDAYTNRILVNLLIDEKRRPAAVAALAIAGVSLSAAGGDGSRRTSDRPAANTPPTRSGGRTQAGTHVPSVRLVAYTGAQPAGFTVAKIPAGYVLEGAQPTTLDIAEPGDHTSIDSFVDKLVVSLQSTDATTPTTGKVVKVNGEPGIITVSDGVHTLTYSDGSHEVQVQAWSDIHLTDNQLVTFAEGVTITSAVQPTHG